MKPITIIYGPEQSGKSLLSKQMSLAFEKPSFLIGKDTALKGHLLDSPFALDGVEVDTDVVVVDNVHFLSINPFVRNFYNDEMEVNPKYDKRFKMKTPKLILVLQADSKADLDLPDHLQRKCDFVQLSALPERFELSELYDRAVKDAGLDEIKPKKWKRNPDLGKGVVMETSNEPV